MTVPAERSCKTASLQHVNWSAVKIVTLQERADPSDPALVKVRATIRPLESETTLAGRLVTTGRSYVVDPKATIENSLGVSVLFLKQAGTRTFIAVVEDL